MRKAPLYILTAALLAVALFCTSLSADPQNKYRQVYQDRNGNTYYALRDGRTSFVDTLFGDIPDTVTVRKAKGCRGFSIAFVPDSISDEMTAATDSIAVFYRPVFLDSWLSIDTGSAAIALLIRNDDGDTTSLLDWAPGGQYWIELIDPLIYAPLYQFIFHGSAEDTIIVNGVIEQIKIEATP